MSITNRITGDQKISGFVNIYNQNNENIENALKEYKDDYKKLDSEIKGKFDNELKRIKNNLTSDIVNLNQNINKFEEKIEKISEGFQSEVDNQIKSVIEIFRNEYKNDIDNIKEDVQSNIDEKIINSKNEVFSSVDEKLDILKKSITSLETKYDDDTKKISKLQNKIETSEKTSEKTQKDITQHYKDIEKIKNDITNLNELFNFKLDVNKKLDEIESKIIDLDAHVSLHVSNYMNSENTKKFINDSVNDSVNHLIDTDDFKDNLKNEITNEIQELKNEDIKQINDSLKNTNIILKYCCDCLDILKQKMEISNDEWPEIPNEII